MYGNYGGKKRTFKDIRKAILLCLSYGQHTINQISYKTRINWKTVELHLTYLVGKRLVNEVFNSDYVRIFELSQDGRLLIKSLGFEITEGEKLVDQEDVRIEGDRT